jgi:hypothetical protein
MPEGALPPDQVRIEEVHVEPWPDGQRVRVHLTVSPFQKPPSLTARIATSGGNEVALVHIIETIQTRMVFTMHIRTSHPADEVFTLGVDLYYPELNNVDTKTTTFSLPNPAASPS